MSDTKRGDHPQIQIMKPTQILTIASLAAAFALTGCGEKKTETSGATAPEGAKSAAPAVVDEKTAIENFKKEATEIGKFAEAKMKEAQGGNPMAAMTSMGEVFAKLKAIKTDGMPADFKAAWADLNVAFTDMGELFKSLPKADKPEDGMKAMMELMPRMQAIQAKLEPAQKKVEELAKKYGFDMNQLMPKQ
jgi:hypothetical protein